MSCQDLFMSVHWPLKMRHVGDWQAFGRNSPVGDKTLNFPIQQMLEGWPEHCRSLTMILRHFWQLKAYLFIKYSCMSWKDRFFIPVVLRSKCLQTLHNGHPGITKMHLRTCTSRYWPTKTKKLLSMFSHVFLAKA